MWESDLVPGSPYKKEIVHEIVPVLLYVSCANMTEDESRKSGGYFIAPTSQNDFFSVTQSGARPPKSPESRQVWNARKIPLETSDVCIVTVLTAMLWSEEV